MWRPDSMAGGFLKAWHRFDLVTGADTSTVASVADSSGNGNTATGSASNPTLETAEHGGLNVIRSGVSKFFTLPSTVMSGATEATFFAVCQAAADPGASDGVAGPLFGNWDSETLSSHYPYTDGTVYCAHGSTVRKTAGNPTPSLANWHLVVFRSKASDWRMAINGTSVFTTATNTFGTGTDLRYFHANRGGNYYFDGLCGEIGYFNSFLTDADTARLESWLAWHWGDQANLPGGHAYASVPAQIYQTPARTPYLNYTRL